MIARLLAVFFALCLASAAEAQTFWSTRGSGCVPDEAAIKFDRHRVDNLSVQHTTGIEQQIRHAENAVQRRADFMRDHGEEA